MNIFRTAVGRPVTVVLVFTAFVVFGIFSLMNTSIALMPDFDANVVMVMSTYPGANASDVETNLTKVLENSLNGVENLKDMTTRSKENLAILILEFEYGTDIDKASNDVRDKLDMASQSLPDGASTPFLMKFSADDMPVMILSATAEESFSGLDRILDDRVTTPLARIDGVGTVSVTGAPDREIQVYCDPAKLQAYGLSVAGISQVLTYENQNVPSGNIDIGSETYSLRVEKEFDDPQEMLDVVVGQSNGQAVYLRDVATLVDGPAEKYQESYTNAGRSATIAVTKQKGANTVNVIKEVKEKLPQIQETLPTDVEIHTIIDSSDNIKNSVNSLLETIITTLLVVMLVVYVFLGRWRATFIIAIAIPISLMGSLVYLLATGGTLNLISMSALSIAIGMVVDNSIVVLENVSKHVTRGESLKEAAINGTEEVAGSILGSTTTTLCVFLPLTMVTGMMGILFKQLGWIVTIIMLISTAAALTLVPVMCANMLSAKPKTGKVHVAIFGRIDRWLEALSDWYSGVARWCVTHRKTVIFTAVALVAFAAVVCMPSLKSGYFPTMDEGRLSATVYLPVGTEQGVTGRLAAELDERIRTEIPEVQILQYSFGQASTDNTYASMQSNGSYLISMNINVGSMEDRDVSASEIADKIRAIFAEYPEIRKALVTEGMGGVGGATSIELEVYGYDFDVTDALAREAQQKMVASEKFTQVTLSRDEYTPEYQVDFDREKLALNGLNSTTAASAFSAAMSGSVGSYFREEGDEYSIRVRYSKDYRSSVEDIENMVVYNGQGRPVRIKELGDVVETQVPPTIERKNRERYITVTGITNTGVAMSEGVEAINEAIDSMDIPVGYSMEISGDVEDQQEMFSSIAVLFVLIVILVYMVMAAQFESFVNPFVIMFSIPFGMVGVLVGHVLTGMTLNVMSMIGLLILVGIVVNNGIVLIDYIMLMQERGMNAIDAAVAAARSRLKPILMTTLTTVIGMLPLAFGQGEGSEMWRSLGMSVAVGLSLSTIVTLILIPTIYCVFATRKERRVLRKQAVRKEQIAAENAD